MKKVFQLKNLDCANCARKMEDAVRRLEGVSDVQISFLMQKMTLVAPEEDFERIMASVEKTCRRVEPDCRIIM